MLTWARTDSQRTKRLAYGAVLTSLALIFSYIEFLIPVNIGAPGIKPGLANIVVVVCIYRLSPKYAVVINVARIFLVALLFGSMFSALYALAGGLLSLAVMVLLKKTKLFSVVGVSMAGGVAHNLGQIIASIVIMQTKEILLYFPVLVIAGMITGIVNGFISALVLRTLRFQM